MLRHHSSEASRSRTADLICLRKLFALDRSRFVEIGIEVLKLAAAIIISASITALVIKSSERRGRSIRAGTGNPRERRSARYDLLYRHNLSGPQHARARGLHQKGLPVRDKAEDGKVYLLAGKAGDSVNTELADYAAQGCYQSGERKLPGTGLRSSRSKGFEILSEDIGSKLW